MRKETRKPASKVPHVFVKADISSEAWGIGIPLVIHGMGNSLDKTANRNEKLGQNDPTLGKDVELMCMELGGHMKGSACK